MICVQGTLITKKRYVFPNNFLQEVRPKKQGFLYGIQLQLAHNYVGKFCLKFLYLFLPKIQMVGRPFHQFAFFRISLNHQLLPALGYGNGKWRPPNLFLPKNLFCS